MKKRSTRQRIATGMGLLTGVVVLLVVSTINVMFFANWYRSESRKLTNDDTRPVLGRRLPKTMDVTPEQAQQLREGRVRRKLSQVDERWFVIGRDDAGEVAARHVTPIVERQLQLLRGSLIVILLAGLVSFGLAWLLTKRLMRDIEQLTEFVESREVKNLHASFVLDHLPATDTLARLASSINTTNHQLLEQIDTIKQFALYAAHELKSPLMSMQGSLDLALKTQNYHKYHNRLKTTVVSMQGVINTLLQTIDVTRGSEEPELLVVRHLIDEAVLQAEGQYGKRELSLGGSPAVAVRQPRGALTTVLRNLIANAWKYHHSDLPIRINWTGSVIEIININTDVTTEDLASLWIPFWQKQTGTTEGHGLGLSIVQSICEVMNWEVCIEKVGDEVRVRVRM